MNATNPVILQTDAGTAFGSPRLPTRLLQRLLEGPDEFLRQNLIRPVKMSHQCLLVVAQLALPDRVVPVAYKQYRARNGWKAFWAIFRCSRALEAWRLSQTLIDRGIPTAAPLFAIQPAGWRHRATSYLATEWIDGAENLHQFGWRLLAEPLDARLRLAATCAKSLGRLLGRMHAAGVSHRDLKGANLLVVQRQAETATYVIDLDGVRICRKLTVRRRAKDLSRLAVSLAAHPWVSRTICCRFLLAYVAESSPGTVAWKPLWRAIAARSMRIVRRKQQRGQQVL